MKTEKNNQFNHLGSKQKNIQSKKDFEEMFNNPNHPKYVGNEYELLSEYINIRTKVKIKHKKCGTIYEVKSGNFKENNRCPNCFGYRHKNILGKKDFEEMFNNPNHPKYVGNEYELLSEYVNSQTKVEIIHKKCGTNFHVRPNNFKNHNSRCPICAGNNNKWVKKDFEKMFSNPNHPKYVGDEYELLSEYKNNTTKVKILHKLCGKIYHSTPDNFKVGKRCARCSTNGTSQKEKELQKWVKKHIDIETNERFYDDGKYIYELDIYIPSKKIGIEFNGIYWHSELNGKDENYHLNKTKFFEKLGIEVIHIFENEWEKNKKEIKKFLIEKIENKMSLNSLSVKKKNKEIIINRRLDNGKWLESMGWKLKKQTNPKIYYSTEKNRIWDCGNLVFTSNL